MDDRSPMRTKDHHLKLRGKTWYIRYDIPEDLRDTLCGNAGRTMEESLKTRDKATARRLRDLRLAELNAEWTKARVSQRRSSRRADLGDPISQEHWAYRVRVSDDPKERDNFEAAMDAALGDIEMRVAQELSLPKSTEEDIFHLHEAMHDDPAAQEYGRAMAVYRGDATPISVIGEEYLSTIGHLNESTLSTRRKAFRVLEEAFKTAEEINKRKARLFLSGLMTGENARSRQTVGQYCQAWRGAWEHMDRDPGLWTLKGLDSEKRKVRRAHWTDDDYARLLKAAREKGHHDMALAIRIAAYTGAAAQGIASAVLVDEDRGQPSIQLTETKKEWRSRKIPCHPAILDDMKLWQARGTPGSPIRAHDAKSLSRKFTRLKMELGFGEELVLHSFRHAVANKLENARALDREVKRLLGHHMSDITFGTYSAAGLGYEELRRVVELIAWPEVG